MIVTYFSWDFFNWLLCVERFGEQNFIFYYIYTRFIKKALSVYMKFSFFLRNFNILFIFLMCLSFVILFFICFDTLVFLTCFLKQIVLVFYVEKKKCEENPLFTQHFNNFCKFFHNVVLHINFILKINIQPFSRCS